MGSRWCVLRPWAERADGMVPEQATFCPPVYLWVTLPLVRVMSHQTTRILSQPYSWITMKIKSCFVLNIHTFLKSVKSFSSRQSHSFTFLPTLHLHTLQSPHLKSLPPHLSSMSGRGLSPLYPVWNIYPLHWHIYGQLIIIFWLKYLLMLI